LRGRPEDGAVSLKAKIVAGSLLASVALLAASAFKARKR